MQVHECYPWRHRDIPINAEKKSRRRAGDKWCCMPIRIFHKMQVSEYLEAVDVSGRSGFRHIPKNLVQDMSNI